MLFLIAIICICAMFALGGIAEDYDLIGKALDAIMRLRHED